MILTAFHEYHLAVGDRQLARTGRKRKSKVTLPGMGGAVVEKVAVDDPYNPGKTETVNRVMNRTAIERIHGRGRLAGRGDTIDDANARLRAAVRLLGIWETAGGRGAGAVDYSAIKVDVSFSYDGTPEWQSAALKDMVRIRAFVGPYGFRMLEAIVIDNTNFMEWVEKEYPQAGHRTRLDAYQDLRNALDRLIEYFGQAVGRQWVPIRVSRETIPSE